MFLSRKPTVPPTFDGVDFEDNARLKAAQDAIIREQWVKNMMARLIRDELKKCYYREGVNHLEKCGALRGRSHWLEWIVHSSDGFVEGFVDCCAMEADFRYIERYFRALKEGKVTGYLFEQQNYIAKREES